MPADNHDKRACHGQPWCPTGWRQVPLSSVAEVRFSSVDKLTEGGERPVRLCNYTDVYNNEYITADMDFMRATATAPEIVRFGLKVGDVIITKDSETPDDIGVSGVVDSTANDLVCGYHLALLRPDTDQVDPTFLVKQLRHHRVARYFGQQANGSTRYGLSTSAISSSPLCLPELEDQHRVASILRLADAAVSQANTVVAKLLRVRIGLRRDLVTHGLDEHGSLRNPVVHPEQFVPSPQGQLPTGWSCTTLGEAFNTSSGGTPSRGRSDFWGGDIPWVKTGEINYSVIRDTEEKITQLGMLSSAARLLPAGTVVMALFGQGPTRGRVAILGIPATVNQACLAFIPKGRVNGSFLFHLLSEKYEAIRRLSNLGAQQNLNAALVRSLPVTLPPYEEQCAIADVIDGFDQRISAELAERGKLSSLASSLRSALLDTTETP